MDIKKNERKEKDVIANDSIIISRMKSLFED